MHHTHKHKHSPAAWRKEFSPEFSAYGATGHGYHGYCASSNHFITGKCACGATRYEGSSRSCPTRWIGGENDDDDD